MEFLIVKKKYGSFLVPEFEGSKLANKCLPYDLIIPTDKGCSLSRRTEYPLMVGILETTKSKYGFTGKGNPIYLCKPLNEQYPPFYIGSKIKDIIHNKLITFQFDSWPENSEFPKGTFIELLGDCGDFEAEKKSCLLKACGVIWKKILPEIIMPSFENRMKLSGYTFNIDPDGCKDIDDCITIWDNSIAISIADVSAFVEVNPWMKYAEFLGTSLYEHGICVKPMFPRNLSEDLMSLVEGKERLAYSLIITNNSWKFEETIVKVDKSYTYDNFPNNQNRKQLVSWVEKISGIKIDNIDNHKIIEILMLYYNTKAGEVLKKKNSGILRSQKGMNVERAKLFEAFSEEYMYLCYESAKYCLPNEDTIHQQLEIQHYAHASSPIRRYVDIINQFALKEKTISYQTIHRFNQQQKAAKTYERDLVYLDLYKNKRNIDGIIIDSTSCFIPLLKKIIKLENNKKVKEKVLLRYYINPQNFKWKDKIIFELL